MLHHAGGSPVLYRPWPAGLPDTWDVRRLDAPGHGLLLGLPQISHAGRPADVLLRSIEPELACPCALFGHSMGALVTYESTRRDVDRGLPLPVWAGVPARSAPQPAGPGQRHHELPDAELRTRPERLGGTPDEVFDDPGLWALSAPVIRADLRLAENGCRDPDAGPLPAVLSAHAGGEDHSASPPRMAGREEHTEHFPGLRVFGGGHFPFQDDPGPLLRQIERDSATALDAARAQPTAPPSR